jgi:ketosteroid isomerase-like protein
MCATRERDGNTVNCSSSSNGRLRWQWSRGSSQCSSCDPSLAQCGAQDGPRCRLVSEQNVELHRRFYEAFNARDVDSLVTLCGPGITVQSAFAAVSGAVYHGHDGVRRWQRDLAEAWGGDIRVEIEAYFDLGEQTLAFDVLHGRGRHSGAEVALPAAAVANWRDRKCVDFKAYAHREEALRDLGVFQRALEPIAP